MNREELVHELRSAGCVYAEDEARLLLADDLDPSTLREMINRRKGGEPLEYVLGWAEFYGLRVQVAPTVFVPRRRSEFMVDVAKRHAKPGCQVLDLCCGSGALGLAIASAVPGVRLAASDFDATAVACAHANLESVGGSVYQSDMFRDLPRNLLGRVDLILANTPYVPSSAIARMPSESRLYEPHFTLDGGNDGLDFHRLIAQGAPEWLAPGGCVMVEVSEQQAADSVSLFKAQGFLAQALWDEEREATVVAALRPM